MLPLSSTRIHHNLSVDVAAQGTDVTSTAQQEKQCLQELLPGTDPLVPDLVLQVQLGLAMAVDRLELLKHQSKGLEQKESENTAGRLKSPESSMPEGKKKGHGVRCQRAVPCDCRECQLKFGLPK